jgi:hypothetical protein
MMRTTWVLSLLILATALPLGGCYVDAGPPPPAGYYYGGRPAPPHAYYRGSYEWHTYRR